MKILEAPEWVLELASLAGRVANVCDHIEHNEECGPGVVSEAGRRLRSIAVELSLAEGWSPVELYRERLRAVERRNVVWSRESFDGPAAVPDSPTWRQLQLVQYTHDRYYHVDVLGLSKSDQLRHCAFHVAKLAGAAADVYFDPSIKDDFVARRVPDMLLFGIKLATLCADRLPDAALTASDH